MLATALHLAITGAILMAGFMLLLWIIHLLIRNAAIVDVGWAAGLAMLAIVYAMLGPGYFFRRWIVAGMVAFWGLRLAFYLLFSRVIGKPEEGRYVQLRREWKSSLPLRFLFFFEFQALLTVILSLPLLVASLNSSPSLGALEKIGVAIWLVSMCGEACADFQLHRFRKNPRSRGKTFRGGLWRYSRHPNYFFEWMIWVAYAVFALGSPWGWLGLLSPALMLFFLLGSAGIAATEAQALRTRGAEYRAYQRSTSTFIPWFPRNNPA
jgi:steroid 5-alpha reductase family enzyme